MSASAFTATLVERVELGPHVFVLRLAGCEALAGTRPGQFVMMRGDWGRDPLLPRAFSLLAVLPGGEVTVLIKAAGRGTALCERAAPGARFSVLGPLGHAFPAPSADRHDLLVAGGVGLAPILMQADAAVATGHAARCEIVYGARTAADLVLRDACEARARTHYSTDDGSLGRPGRVTEPLAARLSAIAATGAPPPTLLVCGPNPMMAAVRTLAHEHGAPCYVSLEGEMACGYGVCLGCAVAAAPGAPGAAERPYRYVCKDGPVFPADHVEW